jgi:hypothetical protein
MATAKQKQQLYGLLAKLGWKDLKESLVSSYTDGRTQSCSEMTPNEIKALLTYLIGEFANKKGKVVLAASQVSENAHKEKADKMRKKIIAMAHKLFWKTPQGKADMQRIDNWCINHSSLKKKLMEHTIHELPALVSQFELMYLYYLENAHINKTKT